MDNSIDLFRQRRQKRIEARKDAGDIQWISTEEGSHIPLQNGKSVGGWSKGKDFSSAKTKKSEPKGTSSPTQKFSRALKKCKTKSEYRHAINNAAVGSKIYMQVGDTIDGFEKTGEGIYGNWKRIYGTGKKGETVEGWKLGVRAEVSDYCGTTVKEAHGRMEKIFPRISKEYGTRKSSEASMRDKSSATYYKGLSGKKELYEAANKEPHMVKVGFRKFLKENGVDVDNCEYDYDPKTKIATVKTEESHGRGKPKTETVKKYRVKLTGGKYTTVSNKGEVVKTHTGGDAEYVYKPKFIAI